MSAVRTTPNEGPMHLANHDKSIDSSLRKKRAPQDDKVERDVDVFHPFASASQRLAEIHAQTETPLRGAALVEINLD